jgi:hypothetical protein
MNFNIDNQTCYTSLGIMSILLDLGVKKWLYTVIFIQTLPSSKKRSSYFFIEYLYNV